MLILIIFEFYAYLEVGSLQRRAHYSKNSRGLKILGGLLGPSVDKWSGGPSMAIKITVDGLVDPLMARDQLRCDRLHKEERAINRKPLTCRLNHSP